MSQPKTLQNFPGYVRVFIEKIDSFERQTREQAVQKFAERQYVGGVAGEVGDYGNFYIEGKPGLYEVKWKAVSYSSRPTQDGEWLFYRWFKDE